MIIEKIPARRPESRRDEMIIKYIHTGNPQALMNEVIPKPTKIN